MKNNGFTLIELLITLAVVITLATVAVPGFQHMMAKNRLAADYNEVLSGLNYARSEAIKRRKEVIFTVTGSSPWRYEITSRDGEILRTRSGQGQSVSLAGTGVEFGRLGRSDCVISCQLIVEQDSDCFKKIMISGFGSVSRSDCGGEEP